MEHFAEYKKQNEPEKHKKAENWGIAVGLQRVDNLTPSKYLIEVAKDNIEGKISIDEAEAQISRYYKENPAKTASEHNEREADEVSARHDKRTCRHAGRVAPHDCQTHRRFKRKRTDSAHRRGQGRIPGSFEIAVL